MQLWGSKMHQNPKRLGGVPDLGLAGIKIYKTFALLIRWLAAPLEITQPKLQNLING